ncbi:MAG TPA: CehA/McbA family metallohydrolase, partial [Thermomicrobiales bacterium]|nr:CehA/McbA family metallohydrolase [Thermomicrobiales bacterium]
MTADMRIGRWFWTLVALVAAGVLFFALVVPRSSQRVDVSGWRDLAAVTVAGAYHVHTTRSDGLGDKAAVAAAARRAGLQFVIVTDHGDGTRAPDAPAYVDGVLCLDGVEISTDNGHYVALDMPRAPYPLGGSGDAVIRDVHRFGGFGVIAHPDSPKSALRWTGSYEGIDGIEWLNLDSEWRRDSRVRLVRAGLGYLIRPGPALATLFDRPETLARWDGLAARRQTVGLAAVDAHGGIQGSPAGGHEMGISGFPSYEASFKSITNRVVLDAPLTGDAPADARAVYSAIRHGRVFSTIDAVASPALLDFHLESAAGRVVMGGTLATVGAATIVARAPMPAASEMGLLRDGREVARSSTGLLRFDATQTKGAYRIEIHVPHAPGNPPI